MHLDALEVPVIHQHMICHVRLEMIALTMNESHIRAVQVETADIM